MYWHPNGGIHSRRLVQDDQGTEGVEISEDMELEGDVKDVC